MRAAASAGAALAALCVFIPSAQAALHPLVDAEFDKIVEYNYRGSAQNVQPACSALCQELRAAETRPGGWSTPAVEQLNREARTLRVSTGLTNAIRLGSSFTLGLAAFDVGYRIGSGANAKFLRIGLPAKSPNLSAAPQRLTFAAPARRRAPARSGASTTTGRPSPGPPTSGAGMRTGIRPTGPTGGTGAPTTATASTPLRRSMPRTSSSRWRPAARATATQTCRAPPPAPGGTPTTYRPRLRFRTT